MPVKRRVAKTRTRADDLSETAWALLTDQPLPDPAEAGGWEVFVLECPGSGGNAWGPTLEGLWAAHGEAITADWAAEHPGTRPACWWRWTAPRAAAGTRWGRYEVRDATQFPDPRKRLGGIGTPAPEGLNTIPRFELGLPVDWAAADPSDPPTFESQASYLKRHGLFLAGEERRVPKADFVPEKIKVGEP
jgi:hypothetical protein